MANNKNNNSSSGRGKNYRKRNSSKSKADNLQDRFAKSMERKGYDTKDKSLSTSFNSNSTPFSMKSSDNDPSWYKPNEQLYRDVTQIPFGYATGTMLPTRPLSTYQAPASSILYQTNTAGIMSLNIVPTFGNAESDVSPITVAANSLFTAVRQATSGTSYYEAPDLMMYMLAMDSAYSYYAFMVRAYGVLSNYSVLNKYTPQALISSMGLSFSDLQSNMADFRAYINSYAYRLGSFVVPTNINYIARHLFMYENVYMDANSSKAQFYLFNPVGFYLYSETAKIPGSADTGHLLDFKPLRTYSENFNTNMMTFADLQTYGNELLYPLMSSEDIRLIAADVLKAFGLNNLFKVSPISETYTVTPVYNAEVLMQMENAFIFPNPSNINFKLWGARGINSGWLKSQYYYKTRVFPQDTFTTQNYWQPVTNEYAYLNKHGDAVTNDDVMVMTRLSNIGLDALVPDSSNPDGTTNQGGYTLAECGSEIVAGADIWYHPHISNTIPSTYKFCTLYPLNAMGIGGNSMVQILRQYHDMLSARSQFDWAPRIQPIAYSDTDTYPNNYRVCAAIWEVDNFSWIHRKQLSELNRVALLGEFIVETAGMFSPNPKNA